ncbi:PLD nuclease N-terminal domain-containing protein [Microbacterium sp.]|uniref:PLD nuclease N-terminal domain-containing protein n=1 Tax=Microbacterium sp. TaxID=51671 RepID=UPI003A912DE0
MARLLLILALMAVIFWVFTIVDVAVQPAWRHRGVGKPMWVAIVIVFPVLGGILWLAVGRAPATPRGVRAPDDDPEFLRGLGSTRPGSRTAPPSDADRRSRAEQDERIRQLEQDLARLDHDDDDPTAGPRS